MAWVLLWSEMGRFSTEVAQKVVMEHGIPYSGSYDASYMNYPNLQQKFPASVPGNLEGGSLSSHPSPKAQTTDQWLSPQMGKTKRHGYLARSIRDTTTTTTTATITTTTMTTAAEAEAEAEAITAAEAAAEAAAAAAEVLLKLRLGYVTSTIKFDKKILGIAQCIATLRPRHPLAVAR